MKLFFNIVVCLFLLILPFLTKAQSGKINMQDSDTLKYNLKEVEIFSSRLNDFQKPNLKKIESKIIDQNQSDNLGDLINSNSSFDVKTYGIPGIATASKRGVSTYHNPVIINGFNVQDPLNGGVDLSLIPVFFIDEAFIKSGGGSSLFGSGAIGGSIHLNNSNSFNNGFSFKSFVNAASIANYQLGAAISYSNKNFSNTTKVIFSDNQNNFAYFNTYAINSPIEIQKNATQSLNGIMQSNSFLIKKNMKLNSNLWYISSYKKIPSRLDQLQSYQNQSDKSLRYTMDYNLFKGDNKFTFRNAVFHNNMVYNKTDIDLIAEHSSFTYLSEFEARLKFRENDILNFGINHQYISSTSSSLTNNPEINSSSLFVLYNFNFLKRYSIKAAVRNEIRNSDFKPPNFELTTGYKLKKLKFWMSISTNYRMPTLNDLYWNDAYSRGNLNLLDENSENAEIGMAYKIKAFDFNISAYQTNVHNMILWTMSGDYWTPVNKKEVLSKGIEAKLKYLKSFKKLKILADASYSFNSSINNNKNDEFYKNQITYAPNNKASVYLSLEYRGFSISYNQKFTSTRYINDDNSKSIDAFYPADFSLSFSHKLKDKSKLKYNLKINNIFNQSYVVMPAYPMPLRFFDFGIRYCLN